MHIGRKQREWYPGAIYHLMERGIRRQEIFTEEMDYQMFMEDKRCQAQLNFYKQVE